MNAVIEDIKDMLEAESSLGLALASNLFLAKETPKPDNAVFLFETPGYPPSLGLTTHGYYYPSFQVMIRDRSFTDGMTLAYAIMESLHGRAHEAWGGIMYELIQCMTEPFLLEWDDNSRAKIVINFNVQRRNV